MNQYIAIPKLKCMKEKLDLYEFSDERALNIMIKKKQYLLGRFLDWPMEWPTDTASHGDVKTHLNYWQKICEIFVAEWNWIGSRCLWKSWNLQTTPVQPGFIHRRSFLRVDIDSAVLWEANPRLRLLASGRSKPDFLEGRRTHDTTFQFPHVQGIWKFVLSYPFVLLIKLVP